MGLATTPNRSLYISFLLSFFSCFLLRGQESEIKHVNNNIVHEVVKFLEKKENFTENNQKIRAYIRDKQIDQKLKNSNQRSSSPCELDPDDIVTIPIVIHIIHENGARVGSKDNPSTTALKKEIKNLNDAFRNIGFYKDDGHGAKDFRNPDKNLLKSVDTRIQFCLARQDKNGTLVGGLYRYANNRFANLNIDGNDPQLMQEMIIDKRGGDLFPKDSYINIWIVKQIKSVDVPTDVIFVGQIFDNGIMRRADEIGKDQDAATFMVSTMGGYLYLESTTRGGCETGDCNLTGDYVCDTPPQRPFDIFDRIDCNRTKNTCQNDHRQIGSPFTRDQDDMHENYMAQSSPECRNTFTNGQKERMRSFLYAIRPSLLYSRGCLNPYEKDLGISNIQGVSVLACESDISPTIDITNYSKEKESSTLTIEVILDGRVTTLNPEINLKPGETTTFSLGDLTISQDKSHALQVTLTQINGKTVRINEEKRAADKYFQNNCVNVDFSNPEPLQLNYCDDFESGTIRDFIINNPTGSTFEVVDLGSSCTDQNGSKVIRYNSNTLAQATGGNDALVFKVDLTEQREVTMSFDYSSSKFSLGENTTLEISVSDDCQTFQSVYSLSGNQLNTAKPVVNPSVPYAPDGCEDWQSASLSLSQYIGKEVTVRIQVTLESGFSQNLYLDNICIKGGECPDLSAVNIDPVIVTDKSCGDKCTEVNGSLKRPLRDCPTGSYMEYSIDKGNTWSRDLPLYDQDAKMTIRNRCKCSIESTVFSDFVSIETNPIYCPTPEFEITVTHPTCDTEGQLNVTTNQENLNYEITSDGINYEVANFPIIINSGIQAEVVYNIRATNDQGCSTEIPPVRVNGIEACCPTFTKPDPVVVTDAKCVQECTVSEGKIEAPASGCPEGSVMAYKVDDGEWSLDLPTYDQTKSVTIYNLCICIDDFNQLSAINSVKTNPQTCTNPDFEHNTTQPTCTSDGVIAFNSVDKDVTFKISTDNQVTFSSIDATYSLPAGEQVTSTLYLKATNKLGCVTIKPITIQEIKSCTKPCPDLSQKPSDIQIIDSQCQSGCVVNGGNLEPATNPCPEGSTIIYSTDGQNWSKNIPEYDHENALTIISKCLCDSDPSIESESNTQTTNPGTCITPALSTQIQQPTCENEGTITFSSGNDITVEISEDLGNTYTNFISPIVIPAGEQATKTILVKATNANGCHNIDTLIINEIQSCTEPCPNFSIPPLDLIITESSCGEGCTPKEGNIRAQEAPCPIGSSVEYSTNGGSTWNSTLPIYDNVNAMTILSRCKCTTDANNFSLVRTITTSPNPCSAPQLTANVTSQPDCEEKGIITFSSSVHDVQLDISYDGGRTYTLSGSPLDIPAGEQSSQNIKIRATNDKGCSSIETLTINEVNNCTQPCPELYTKIVTQPSCKNKGVLEFSSTDNNATLELSLDNGTTFNEETSPFELSAGEQESRTLIVRATNIDGCATNETITISEVTDCAIPCPTFTEAPSLSVIESTCLDNCELNGGSIDADAEVCPAGSSLYISSDNGSSWSKTLPIYKQNSAITILAICQCNSDKSVKSPESTTTTNPGECIKPSLTTDLIDPTCQDNGEITLNTTPNGTLEYSTNNGNSFTEETTSIVLLNNVTSQTKYIIKATAENGCTDFDTLSVTPATCDEFEFFIPNVFSPYANNEKNKFFGPVITGEVTFISYEMKILNRWGSTVFATSSIEDTWDGLFKGEVVENGVYVYTINFKYKEFGKEIKKIINGTITLTK